MKVNDTKQAFFAAELGFPVGSVALQDAEMRWLREVKLRAGDTLAELWTAEFIAVCGEDDDYAYLRFLGYIYTLPEMWSEYWLYGAVPRPPLTHLGIPVTYEGELVYHGSFATNPN